MTELNEWLKNLPPEQQAETRAAFEAEWGDVAANNPPPKTNGRDLQGEMAAILDSFGLSYQREYRFHPARRWRFDFALPELKLAIECDGGGWSNGRHTRGKGFIEDCKKLSEAALLGWRVIRVTTVDLDDNSAWDYARRIAND